MKHQKPRRIKYDEANIWSENDINFRIGKLDENDIVFILKVIDVYYFKIISRLGIGIIHRNWIR